MSGHRDARPRARLATVWLGGCAGCHMSFLDLDEWLFDLLERVDVVYSPLVDRKDFPDGVDVVLVEGAVTNEDNLRLARELRARSATVVAFGDCAVTGNVTALRNLAGPPDDLLRRVYGDHPGAHGELPRAGGPLPALLARAVPLHAVVPVDVYLPGCPPDAVRIRAALTAVLDGDGDGDFDIRFG